MSSTRTRRVSAPPPGQPATGGTVLRGVEDEVVLERSLKNPAFFVVLVERYEDGFLRAAHRVVRSREEAEDVVQDAFVKIYTKAHLFEKQEGASFKSWAYKVLVNTAYSHYRKAKRREVPLEEFFDSLLFSEALVAARESEIKQEKRDMVRRALEELPEGLADLVRAHYFEGLSYKEIALGAGLSVSALKTRLHRARSLLKKYFVAANQ